VSLKSKAGPSAAHATITPAATMKVDGWPDAWAVVLVRRVNQLRDLVGRIVPPASIIRSPSSPRRRAGEVTRREPPFRKRKVLQSARRAILRVPLQLQRFAGDASWYGS